MKQLQCNFTTTEQSKRLLELGVPADSADCYLNGDSVIILNSQTFQENYNEDLDLARLHLIEYPHYIPCWSVGRLIEIAKICSKSRDALRGLFSFLEECKADECMSQVMDYFEICNYQFDFSKLEE